MTETTQTIFEKYQIRKNTKQKMERKQTTKRRITKIRIIEGFFNFVKKYVNLKKE